MDEREARERVRPLGNVFPLPERPYPEGPLASRAAPEPDLTAARALAAAMHAESVTLWNLYWLARGERPEFREAIAIETMQSILSDLAWPDA